MSVPSITPLTDLPSIADPSNFDARADNLITQQFPRLVNEINAAGVAMDQAVQAAHDAAAVAVNGTSATNVTISSGAKNFTVLAGHSWSVGGYLQFNSRASPSTHWIIGQITAYNATLLTIAVISFGGSGSRADWNISLSAKPPDLATPTANGLMAAADKAKVDGLDSALAGKAASVHNHTTAQITGLDNALAGKAPSAHNHTTAQVTGLDAALNGKLSNDGGSFSGGYTGPNPSALAGNTLSPTIGTGHERSYTNSGAFTLNAPAGGNSGTICIAVTNGASSGALNALGFHKVHGTFSPAPNKKQLLVIEVHGAGWKTLSIRDDT